MTLLDHQKYTQAQKDANGKAWYKQQIQRLNGMAFNASTGFGDVSEYKRKKVNYDLFNNTVDLKDFSYVCEPYGQSLGHFPAKLTNRDIVSTKIKVLLGMELRRPFSWKALAVNPEATSRKEKETFNRIKNFVVSEIMTPIKQDIELKYRQQLQGKTLSDREKMEIQKQIAEEMKAATPEEVQRYMSREHQDPAEILANQILEYLIQAEDVVQKFNKGWKHVALAGEEIYWVGEINGEPRLKVVNALRFDYGKSPDYDYIEESEWAVCEYRMNFSEIISRFGDELSDTEIEELSTRFSSGIASLYEDQTLTDNDFTFGNRDEDSDTMRVIHCEWRSLCKLGWLTYRDPKTGNIIEDGDLVTEEYKLNPDAGDIEIRWEWFPELHEGWMIGYDKFVGMRPVPGRCVDLDNPYYCPLSYKGAAYDNLNSQVTSPMDRVKAYQYLFNIILYRIELLMASDKGKKLIANIGMIPKSAGIDTDKWMYFFDATGVGWVNPKEEGNRGGADVASSFKEIDLSLVSQIDKYIQLAEYIESKAGAALGIPKELEGQIAPNNPVTNVKQTVIQSSYLLEPYFELHNNVKRNVLQALLDCAKYCYATHGKKKLVYILDDLSQKILDLDLELLEDSSYGVFVTNSSKAAEAKQLVEQLAHAGIQNQTIDVSAVYKIMRAGSATEGEELMQQAEREKAQQVQEAKMQEIQAQSEEAERQRAHEKEKWKHEKDMVILKERERGKVELDKQLILSAGFNPNKDMDRDGQPDILEIARHGLDANIKMRQQDLEEKKFQEQKNQNRRDNALREQEIAAKRSGKTKTS